MSFFELLPSFARRKILLLLERINASIYYRVNFAMIALTLSILLIVSMLSFGVMKHLVRQNIEKTLESEAVNASLRLEHSLNSLSNDMLNLSKNLIISNAIVDTAGRETYIAPFMKGYRLEQDIAVDLTLCDFMGMPIASNVRNPRTFNSQKLLHATIDKGERFAELGNEGDETTLLMAFPVVWVMTNKPEGILVAEIKLAELFNKTLPFFEIIPDRNVSLLIGQKTVLQNNKKEGSIFFRTKRPLQLQPPLHNMSFEFEIDDYRKIQAGWLIGAYAFAGLLFIAATLWVSKMISIILTSRLMVLSDVAKHIAESGSFDLKAEVEGSDEVTALATSFNTMVGKVGESHDLLEKRVRERTEQLFHSNEELNDEIRERKRAEQHLRDSEQFIRNILDTVDEGFIVLDKDFRIMSANKAYCDQSGISCDDIAGKHCYEISHRAQRPCYEMGEDCAVRRVFDTGEPHTSLHRHSDAKGTMLFVETKAFPVKDSSGAVTSVIETVNNITEKHLLEEERLKTQKLEAIGILAGGIAHDFNNLLQGIFGYLSMARMTLDNRERSLAMLEQAERALNMSVDLTTQLLTFSKGGKPVKKILSLKALVENSVKFALSGSRSESRLIMDEDLWEVEADEGQIGQVIQNIVLNADQAMPGGGTVQISARNVQAPLQVSSKLSGEDRYIEIAVKDSGTGIPEQNLKKIFDPYFSTKEKGSGLGLATSYSIINNHNGLINVVSDMGRGTTFFIYLPAAENVREPHKALAAPHFVRKGKILVMDDEEMIRNIAGEMINSLGHDVDCAAHGESAVEQYCAAIKSGNPYDVVILDLTIRGGMGGKETARQLLEIDRNVRAVVSSGYSDDAVVSEFHKHGFKAYLSKPYKIEELRDTLNSLLN